MQNIKTEKQVLKLYILYISGTQTFWHQGLVSLETIFPWTRGWGTEAEAPILWLPDANIQFIGKDYNAGKDWGQMEKRMSEDEMARWHNRTMDMNVGKLQEMVRDREACHAAVHGVTKRQTRLGNWTAMGVGDGLGWLKCLTFIVHFVSSIITSAPPQIIRH